MSTAMWNGRETDLKQIVSLKQNQNNPQVISLQKKLIDNNAELENTIADINMLNYPSKGIKTYGKSDESKWENDVSTDITDKGS